MPLEECFQCRVWADLVGVVWAGPPSLKGGRGVAHHLRLIIRSIFGWAKLGCGDGRPGSLTDSMRRRCAPRSLELRYLGATLCLSSV